MPLLIQVVETVLNSHDHKIDDAIKSLHALCLGDGSVSIEGVNLALQSSDNALEGKCLYRQLIPTTLVMMLLFYGNPCLFFFVSDIYLIIQFRCCELPGI